MTTRKDRQARTISAIRENFDLYPDDWRFAHRNADTLNSLDLCADAFIESSPEHYAELSAKQFAELAAEVSARFN